MYQVFDRLDELSIQLKNKIAEDAKASQQALFAESAGLNSLKEDIVTLQKDVSCLKTHTTALQSDIRFFRADHVDIKMDFSSVKANSEKHDDDTAVLTDDIKNLRKDAEDLRSEFEALRNQSPGVQQDLTELSNNVSGLHNRMETLQSKMSTADVCIVEIDDELKGQWLSSFLSLPNLFLSSHLLCLFFKFLTSFAYSFNQSTRDSRTEYFRAFQRAGAFRGEGLTRRWRGRRM